MVSIQDKIRDKLDRKLFKSLGKVVTLKSKSTNIYNSRGEEENRTLGSSSITIVPYNTVYARTSHERFGDLAEGEMDVAIPYTVTIAVEDLLTIDGTDYAVTQIDKNYLPENVVTIARVAKAG